MPSTWQPYLPHYLLRELSSHPQRSLVGFEQRFDAVVLFADVSGFTAMSEALGATGKSGTEELTDLLNRYFAPMIALIHSYGGIIGKFGGDAMTVLFSYTGETRTATARRALQCAIDMQAHMGAYAALRTSAGRFSLSMKAGLALGPVFCTTVGDPDVRLEYIIAGSALDRCAEAEHHAQKGEVVAEAALLLAAGEAGDAEDRRGYRRVTGLETRAAPKPLAVLAEPGAQAIRSMTAFLHPSIAERLRQGQGSFIDEHRKVTVLFVSFENIDYDHDLQAGAKLQGWLTQVIYAVQRYNGYLNKVDMGDKGSKCILLFGAPIAHENDCERALRCALELHALPGFNARIGVNTGSVFCGQVGSDLRREYTVIGDAVNLAARLMQAAQAGQILVGESTCHETRRAFNWGETRHLQVKGKAEPVAVCELTGQARRKRRLQELEYALPMVGRQAELERIRQRLGYVQQGQGQIVGITAEAGMGKSRLTAEAIRLALDGGLTAFAGECLSHGVNTSYLAWHNLLRDFFDLDPEQSPEAQIAALETRLAAVSPALLPRLPLLGAALGLPVPDNDLTRSLEARLRKESLEALIVACIRQRALQSSLLLVLEDCHWIDPLSNDLLEAVGRSAADLPVLLLVIYRPPEAGREKPAITRLAHFSEIRLAEFTPAEAGQLVALKLIHLLGVSSSIPEGFIERITQRAQGNPFYIDEMVNLIHDRGLNINDQQALQSLDLPDSLHSLILSRMDQLTEQAKTTLKVASVIGRTFAASWLWNVYPPLGAPQQVKEQLDDLSRMEITPLDKPEPELEYLFKHIVTREVAYQSLSVATRAMLHGSVGEYVEHTFSDRLERFLDLLAYHYSLSHNTEKQREYFRKAGDAARGAYANEAAIEYYLRLIPLLSEEERGEVMVELGQVWQVTGLWAEAEDIYRQALALAQKWQNRRLQMRCQLLLGKLNRLKGAYGEALNWLALAQGESEALGDEQSLSDAINEIGVIHWIQGDYAAALSFFERSRQISTAVQYPRGLLRAIGNMGAIYLSQQNYASALAHFEEVLEIAQSVQDRLLIGATFGNMGNVYLEQGNFLRAMNSYTQNLQIAQELGYRLGIGIAIGNIGNVYWYQGDYASTLACQAANLQIALELGDWMGISRALWSIADAYIGLDRFQEASQPMAQAITIARAIDTPDELCEFLLSNADLLTHLENYAAARLANAETLSAAAEVERDDIQFQAQELAVRLEALLGECTLPQAIVKLEQLLESRQDEAEQASLHYQIWHLDAGQEAHRLQAEEQYRRLYARTPSARYRRRFERMSNERLSEPPSLPPLPEIVSRTPVNISKMLAQVEARLGEIASGSKA